MAGIQHFRELQVWQKAHESVLNIYRITNNFPKHELFGLTSQIRRSAVSVAANIVEGFKRKSLRDSINFYNIADSSLEETKYYIFLARDLNYIDQKEFHDSMELCEGVGRLLARWTQSQRQYL